VDALHVDFSAEEASELVSVLDGAIADLSPEIADTDNPSYRAMLRNRRELLRSARAKLNSTDAASTT
jgi:hypothetical protein